ncbi:MAG: DNA gyrase subunit A [Saccharofermentanales bacterium]
MNEKKKTREEFAEAHVVRQNITDTIEKNFMPYAMSVIVSRAIPEIDGFKPAHRKLLYTMYKMGLLTGKRTKSANVVGQTMKLNPHGDSAIYDTLVRLSRGNSSLLHPYIDSKGNFGKQYSRDMAYAASRYTEVKLDAICEELFRNLDKESVDFVDNYDSTTQEPTLLPATFPSILVNVNQGIAVGMASQICSFNLEEVCNATIAYIKDPGVDIIHYMPAPDFESGAEIIYNKRQMRQIYDTGRGPVRLRARFKIDKKNGIIEILDIPYVSTIEKIIEEMTDLVRTGKIKEINDVRDESDKDGFKITIDYKKSAEPEALMMKLFRYTELEKIFSCNFNILINGKPRVLGIKQILGEWASWRRSCVRKETAFDLQKKREKLHLLNGLEKILLDIDLAVKIVRETALAADVVPNLMTGFGIDEIQAEYVADIRLRNLNKQYILDKTSDLNTLKNEIKELLSILENPEKIDLIIISTLKDVIARYAKPRKTQIVEEDGVEAFDEQMLIEDYRLKLFLTDHGYLKKLPLTSLRSAGELKTKEDDRIIMEAECSNKSDVMFFSDKCIVYKCKAYEIKDHKPSDLGEYLTNLLSLDDNENIIFMHCTNTYDGIMMIGFENGKVAKIDMKSYETKTNRKKLVNAFSDSSRVAAMFHITEDIEFAATSSIGKVLVFSSARIPLKASRTNNGVQVLLSKKGSTMSSLVPLDRSGIIDVKYYRNKTIPAIGCYVKEGTMADHQLMLDIKTSDS